MKLIDPETNKEYEFEETHFVSSLNGDYQRGTLKPVDSWLKPDDNIWVINDDGTVDTVMYDDIWADEVMGIYRTEQEAEYARDRIKSLQEARVVMGLVIGEEVSATLILPKKYLKAWRELQDE